MRELEAHVKYIAFLLGLGAAVTWGLVEYVDAQVSKAPWTHDKPFVMQTISEGFKRMDKRLDKLEDKLDLALGIRK